MTRRDARAVLPKVEAVSLRVGQALELLKSADADLMAMLQTLEGT